MNILDDETEMADWLVKNLPLLVMDHVFSFNFLKGDCKAKYPRLTAGGILLRLDLRCSRLRVYFADLNGARTFFSLSNFEGNCISLS